MNAALPQQSPSLVDQIESLLPQTQCRQCGYEGCRPYAQAIADGTAKHNQCPPGGHEGIVRLSKLLNIEVVPLNPQNGIERPRTVAVIDPSQCIGCTLCIQACPVDAIVGGPKRMHVVLKEWCTGCNLCVPPCPVDCIDSIVITTKTGWQAWSPEQADLARARHTRHLKRLQSQQASTDNTPSSDQSNQETMHSATNGSSALSNEKKDGHPILKQALIAKALAKAKARRDSKS